MIIKNLINLRYKVHSNIIKRHYTNRNVLKLHERGLFQDIFPDAEITQARDLLNTELQCVYAGFDPTADSLHVGNLLVLMGLLHWQRAGHRVIALIGGATAQIGDPSGRSTERLEIANAEVVQNTNKLQLCIERIFKNHEEIFWKKRHQKDALRPAVIANNATWYKDMSALSFAGTVGRQFRMGTLLSRSSVQSRLKSDAGMSFTEFTYQIFQSYDWLHLFLTENCKFQLGGSDQMGNIMSGHELISRVTNSSVYGLTLPLITTETGDKFGKSAGNAIWLEEGKTSPFSLYQFFIRVSDADVGKLLKLLTFEPLGEIETLLKNHMRQPHLRLAQKKLAEEVTLLVHGESGLRSARTATDSLYKGDVQSLGLLNIKELESIFREASSSEILPEPGMTLMDVAMKAKCFATPADAERIISAGGFYVNYQRTTNVAEALTPVHILPNNVTIMRVGKKNYHIVKWLK